MGRLTFGAVAALARLVGLRRASCGDHPVRRILLVQLDHLGDAIITTVMLPLLRQHYPRASIEVLAAPWNREVFENVPQVDRVYVSRVNRFARRRRAGWLLSTIYWGFRLRRRRFDVGIDVRGELPHALLLWLAGARRRVGWACGGGGFLLTDSARHQPGRPEVLSRLELLATLGVRFPLHHPPRPGFRPDREARRAVARMLMEVPGPADNDVLAVVHVGAGMPAKMWPVGHWRQVVAGLIGGFRARVILAGTAGERAAAEAICSVAPAMRAANWAGRLNVCQLAALLEQADVFIGADSGPAHLAAAVGTPAVVLFSGTNDPRQWQPIGERIKVVRHPVPCSPCHRKLCPRPGHPCMRGIHPKCVLEAVAEVTGRQPFSGKDTARPAATACVESASIGLPVTDFALRARVTGR